MRRDSGLILVADDDEDIRLALDMLLCNEGYRVVEAANGREIAVQVSRHRPDIVLLDMNFHRDTTSGEEGLEYLTSLVQQGLKVILMTAWGSVDLAVRGMKSGAVDFIEKPWDKSRLLQIIQQQLQGERIADTVIPSPAKTTHHGWIAVSPAMQELELMLEQLAPTDANILILGENGTGKSQLAKRIYQLSQRSESPFVTVNMGAVPATLFESELFGHAKGAFTDAREARTGRFELANGGTLFMDEVGTLPLDVQPKLLRVLETGEYEVLGTSLTRSTDVRVISATNADLHASVSEGKFRQDLLFRLNTFVIELPPLRDRLQDIPPLAEHFLQAFAAKYNKGSVRLSDDAIQRLREHSWPGNIRELSHVIERSVLICRDGIISSSQLMLAGSSTKRQVGLRPLEEVEAELVEAALLHYKGHISKAAQALGISRMALYRRMEKFALDKQDFGPDED
ncbi:sigma-54 dependent transcriptional regulator [Bowmanella denitrificans]|uniref:Sigma-54 dependent transcriptional regulator n=1 Tax=Bowmanella denitrificans TaxID=366582 RepID=A0ABN0XA20_9ALTE